MLELKKEQVLKMFETIPFFEFFTLEERTSFASFKTHLIGLTNGQNIIRQGELDRSVYILIKGKAYVNRREKPNVKLNVLKAGSVFGEIAFFSEKPRSTSVIAQGEAMVLKMDWVLLNKLDETTRNKIKDKLIEVLIERLDDMNKTLLEHIRS